MNFESFISFSFSNYLLPTMAANKGEVPFLVLSVSSKTEVGVIFSYAYIF